MSKNNFVKEFHFQELKNISSEAILHELFVHKVLVIRNSNDIEDYTTLMKKLGKVVIYEGSAYKQFHPLGYPEILRISNLYLDGKCIGIHEEGDKYFLTQWHTHSSYKKSNHVVSALQAHKIHKLQDGTGTEFIDCVYGLNMFREYIASNKINLTVDLDTLNVKHVYGNSSKYQQKNAVIHPLIMNHPSVNYQSLYAISATAIAVEEMNHAKSKLLLEQLQNFLIKYAPRYVHEYQVGDIVIWDNLTTIHRGPVLKASTQENDCRTLYLMNVDWS